MSAASDIDAANAEIERWRRIAEEHRAVSERMAAALRRAAGILGDVDAAPIYSARAPLPSTEPGGCGDGWESHLAAWGDFVRAHVDPVALDRIMAESRARDARWQSMADDRCTNLKES